MKNKYKMIGLAAAVSAVLGMNVANAQAILTFDQVGNDVHATWSGTFDVGTSDGAVDDPSSFISTPGNGLLYYDDVRGYGSGDNWSKQGFGAYYTSTLDTGSGFQSYTGTTFGFATNYLIYSKSLSGVITPTGTFVVTGKTLAEIGADSFESFLAFEGIDANLGRNTQIYFHTQGMPETGAAFNAGAAPEPTSALLSLAGLVGVMTLARRITR